MTAVYVFVGAACVHACVWVDASVYGVCERVDVRQIMAVIVAKAALFDSSAPLVQNE